MATASSQAASNVPKKKLTPVPSAPTVDSNMVSGEVKAKRRGPAPGTPRGPKGPSLTWTEARNKALVRALAAANGTQTAAQVMASLQTHPAFAGVEPSAWSALKVAKQANTLIDAIEEEGETAPPGLASARGNRINVSALVAAMHGDEDED